MRYSFVNCRLDTDAMQLEVDGAPVAMQPQVFDVLRVLIESRERVVSKQELLDEVWGHTFVTESALTSRIKSARQAIGDDGKSQRLIRTVHGRGYQFVGVLDGFADDGPHVSPRPSASLPQFRSRLVGRDRDIAAVVEHLERSRLVTVVGPGGVGKTRLAVSVAQQSGRDAVFVDLGPVGDPSVVMSRIASALGVPAEETSLAHGLADHLQGKKMLLVIDNLEHVVDAAVEIADLVGSVPDLTVVATSRERLRVDGEQIYRLAPLDVEGDTTREAAAIQLFDQHASAVDAGFELDRVRPSVERICRAVDGLPLAIELVASQTATLPVDMLASRLDERLRSSSASRRDLPMRQRTMADTIEWSLQLVTASELRLFGRLGVFAGDVRIDAIETVCCDDASLPDGIEALSRLVDKSLVRRTVDDGVVRFGLLQLLRHRARELLAGDPDHAIVERRHREFIASEVCSIDEGHWSGLVPSWIDHAAALRDEARRALGSAVAAADWDVAATITAAFAMFHHREGGLRESWRWMTSIEPHHDELSDPVLGRLLLGRGLIAWDLNELAEARDAWERALIVLQRIPDEARTSYVLVSLAVAHLEQPTEGDRCRAFVDRGLALARRVAEPLMLAEVLNIAGEFARATGDDEAARPRYEEAFEIASGKGDQMLASIALANVAYLACHDGDFEEGRRIGRRALEMCWALNRRQLAAWSVSELAGPAAGRGDHELAARLIGASQHALADRGGRIYPADLVEHERIVAITTDALGPARFADLCAEGAALSLEQAVRLALGEA